MRPGLVELGQSFLRFVGPRGLVLDLGCGAGRDMAWMEAQGIAVVGADLSAGMLAQAQARVRGPLAQMDMRKLAFPTQCFQGVWCMASLLHLPKSEAPVALGEMRRVLTPGGALVLGLQEGEGEVWEPSPYGPVDRFFARYSPDEAAALLGQAGLDVRERSRGGGEAGGHLWLRFLAVSSQGA